MNYSVIILAAGSGNRMNLGYNKVLYKINDKSIVENSVDAFLKHDKCIEIILVVSKKELEYFKEMFNGSNIKIVEGGKTRSESVYNGLKSVSNEYVMIHDGARPYITIDLLDKLCEELIVSEACILAVKVKDTIKVVNELKIVDTPDRSTLYAAQTPQAFSTKLIRECYLKARNRLSDFSDDSSIVECFSNVKVTIVESSYANVKVTTKEDLR